MNWENTPSTATPLTADNLNHMDEGIEQATDGAIALETEIATARGGSNSLGARLDTVDTNLAKKADKANTLAGYGISDAYTREGTDKKLARKLDSMPFDSEPKNNSPCYLTSGAVYNALLVKATLTPYSTVTDKIKSANCTYKTIGDIVIVSATVKMNAVSLAGNSMCPLIDLPYKCISEDNVFCVGISNLGKLFKFAIPKNNTWLQFSTQDKTAYTFADGEQINVICSYKIK